METITLALWAANLAVPLNGVAAWAAGSTLRATRRRIDRCSHRKTLAMPPEPRWSSSRYLPAMKKPRDLP